ncbi:glycine cleavage system protein GcvH [Geobacter hydrogenophilus]|uniref:Glycine cleavage system H protein n=1 Tax=Geobacter hydrogenophilus TaxID=40983 RepID=A0A9W6FZB9_9BACT|nr:glycine cleavage system protein GcvH [Geobacter hydrogenophilus]MBT0893657.1 glycine cleavage system protein GcvH [Geobacter hydrogenophilus]GLI37646.1 glycine cleavage system H protein [Geobacter hydrogenophilus]
METYFTKEHEWVKVKDGVASVGITEYAAHQLGDVTFVELPKVGKTVKQFEVLAAIESVKAASDIYAPVSGKVTQVNEALDERPEIVNEAAEDAGWMAIMDMADPAELQKLMTREQYDEYVRSLG